MFKDLAENTGEGDQSVICSRCFITFFEDRADLAAIFFFFFFLLAKSEIIKRLLPSEKARIKGQAEVTAAILFHLRGEKLGMPWFVTTIIF